MPSLSRQHDQSARAGLTLLEIVLALALSGIVMGLLGVALHFHLRAVEVQRQDVQRAQLARIVLRRIADDVRGAVRYQPLDMHSLLSGLTGGVGSGDAAALADELLGGAGTAGTAGGTNTPEGGESSGDDVLSTSVAPPTIPGLYGDQFSLQVDVSRIPRPDEYLMMATAEGIAAGQPSDVKTVAYYVAAGDGVASGGLVRAQVDRAAARWAVSNGNYDLIDQQAEVLAPEVVAVEFRYHDGVEWLYQWDSEVQGGLPVAVEITILVGESSLDAEAAPLIAETMLEQTLDGGRIYRLTVHLPDQRPGDLPTAEEQAAEDAAAAEEAVP